MKGNRRNDQDSKMNKKELNHKDKEGENSSYISYGVSVGLLVGLVLGL